MDDFKLKLYKTEIAKCKTTEEILDISSKLIRDTAIRNHAKLHPILGAKLSEIENTEELTYARLKLVADQIKGQ